MKKSKKETNGRSAGKKGSRPKEGMYYMAI